MPIASTAAGLGAFSSSSGFFGAAALELAAISTAATLTQQSIQANRQQEFQEERAEQVNEQARKNYFRQLNQSAIREQEETAAASQRLREARRRRQQAQARARVEAAEAGASGLSVDELISDFARQEGEFRSALDQNLAFSHRQRQFNRQAFRSNNQTRVNQARPRPVPMPDFIGESLRFGSQAALTLNRFSGPDNDGENP